MELTLSIYASHYRYVMDFASGIFIGLWLAFVILFILNLRPIKSRVIHLVIRLFLLTPPLSIATLLTYKWTQFVLSAPILSDYSPHNFPHQALLIGLPISMVGLFEYYLLVRLLDSRWGINSDIHLQEDWIKKLKHKISSSLAFSPLEDQLLDDVTFLASSDPSLDLPLSYGGLLVSPRIVFPESWANRPIENSVLLPLLWEIGNLRRGFPFFNTLYYSFEIPLTRFFNSLRKNSTPTPFRYLYRNTHLTLMRNRRIFFRTYMPKAKWAAVSGVAMAVMSFFYIEIQKTLKYHNLYIERTAARTQETKTAEYPSDNLCTSEHLMKE